MQGFQWHQNLRCAVEGMNSAMRQALRGNLLPNVAQTDTGACALLHAILEALNKDQKVKLKPQDLSLNSEYVEGEELKMDEAVWQRFKVCVSTTKKKPRTRKEWVQCLYFLSKRLFGPNHMQKRETSRNGQKCYNYVTPSDKVAAQMALWKECVEHQGS